MRRYKFMIVALVLLTVCMLCGCAAGPSIDIECTGLEEGERVFVLAKPTDDEELRTPYDADIVGSEIYTAEKDGFVLADQISEVSNVEFGTENLPGSRSETMTVCSVHFNSQDGIRGFCKNHKLIRLAVCDDRWKIKQISSDIDLLDKNGEDVLLDGKFDAATGSFKNAKFGSGEGGNAGRALGYIFIFLLETIAWGANIILLIVMAVINRKERLVNPLIVGLLFGMFSLADPVLIILYLGAEGWQGIPAFLIINIPWLLDWSMLFRYRSRYIKEKKIQEYVPVNDIEYMNTDCNYIMVNNEHTDRSRW
ncbi:hypothetical protein [Ruminococcus albus]|uniref:Lipoprotein n=1 Tax=Ruminococcus albus TaxID=1264 RepID=A0A1I1PXZ7_RUMAL|nr:hypothetical protein [Ruminococcus albus]SFD14635.1 hypothetical protein SAMN02910406_03226 [Ruminococcus albus]